MKNAFQIFYILILFILIPLTLKAQWVQNNVSTLNAWYWINPYPSNKTFNQTNFLNENTGFARIDYKIFKTTNGGVNWNIPGDTNFNNMLFHFQNVNTGYKTCYGGIFKTANSGLNWTLFRSNNDYTVNSMASFPDNSLLYSSTYSSPFGPVAILWYTSNNGLNWVNPVFPGDAQYINDIKVIRNDFAVAIAIDSNKAYLLMTTMPSVSWVKMYTGIDNINSANLYVKDSSTYFISASNDKTYKSVNFGQNWIQAGLNEIKNMQFPSANTGMAIGRNGKVYRSTDGCENWYQIQFPYFYNYEALTFGNAFTGYITGDFGSFYKTTNSGANWISDSRYFTKKTISDVKTIGRDTVILCGDSGYIYTSYNQGINWNIKNTGTTNYLRRLFFLDNKNGYSIGNNGTILKTTDTGKNWTFLNTEISQYWMLDVFFINENTGFVATGVGGFSSVGYLYKTTNGGVNFLTVNTPTNKRFFAVRFINNNTGFLTSFDNIILRTTDTGDSWEITNTPLLSQGISDLQFINSNTGFAAGYNGYVLKTTDSGFNWVQNSQLNTTGLYRIKFINSLTGFITAGGGSSGGKGDIFFTTNRGDNWIKTYFELDLSSNTLNSIDFATDSIGYAVGAYGIILKTTTGGIVGVNKNEYKIPVRFSLSQNYPNPFNPTTNIKYQITNNRFVSLKVFDILGKEIETLVNENQSPGTYEVRWDARHGGSSTYPSGVYFYRLVTDGFTDTKKMILLK